MAASSSKGQKLGRTKYDPLSEERQEIRVLHLLPGEWTDPIEGKLQIVSLLAEPRPVYETTSYVCGDPAHRSPLMLDGQLTDTLATSVAVLRRLRLPSESRTLWMDSICIHQDDEVEKGKQVAFMGKIYAGGRQNLVYLGEGNQDSEKVLSHLQKLVRKLEDNKDALKDALGPSRFGVDETVPGFFSVEDLLPLRDLYASSYFT